ncbi:HAD family hydrolase [Streptomyces sp. SP18CS02]|uniref:HAD family hydrolase n=1 Tax=Streptomyces sp. SP18CS02 TaxID=3002531 RepID=UPI002E793549|nr:HAD family phosphatase [Streptomyces sp. SP18CS02]MEE1756668.1 HAD family phosphatase [Streptomyces sp. SP18CS02]
MTGTVRAVWTDFRGVLTPPLPWAVEAFCRPLGLEPRMLHTAMRTVGKAYGAGSMEVLDTPLATEEEWGRQVEAALYDQFGVTADMSNFAERWFADRRVNQPWIDELRRLRSAGVFVGLLSNMPPGWDAYWRLMVPPEDFDDLVMSFQTGCRKPDKEIFDLAVERSRIPAEQSLLADDLAENCEGAVRAGWHGLHFTDTEDAIRALRELCGIPRTGPGVTPTPERISS